MTKPERHQKYLVSSGQLTYPNRSNPKTERRPGARPVIDSGQAYKTVFLSKAPPKWGTDELNKALDHHIHKMRKEVAADGKLVTKIYTTVWGVDGDCRIVMNWEVLGEKRTKSWRKAQRATVGDVGSSQGREESGRAAPQAENVADGVPL